MKTIKIIGFMAGISAFANMAGAQTVTGSGFVNNLTKWTGLGGGTTTVGNSLLRDDGATISLGNYLFPAPNLMSHIYLAPASINTSNYRIGLDVELFNITNNSEVKAFVANVQGNQTNYGIDAFTQNGTISRGGNFVAQHATSENIGVRGEGNGGSNSYGGFFKSAGTAAVGVRGEATGVVLPNFKCQGGSFKATGSENNYGIFSEAFANSGSLNSIGAFTRSTTTIASGAIKNYGLVAYGIANHEVDANYGIYTEGKSNGNTSTTYGIYAKVSGGEVANGANGSYAGYFLGDQLGNNGMANAAYFNGGVSFSAGFITISDKKFKKDINQLEPALDKIMALSPSTYTFKGKDEFPSFNFAAGKQYGFIAQELQEVFPDLVKDQVNPAQYDNEGKKIADAVNYKGVDYIALIPILTAGIQEQQKMIEAKDAKITELEARIARLEANTPSGIGNTHTTVGAALYQNTPNPFDSYTEIGYLLPQNYTSAKVLVFDMNGKQLRDITLQGTGEGKVQLSSGELAAGMYLYSLIVDNKEVDTKRMILSGK